MFSAFSFQWMLRSCLLLLMLRALPATAQLQASQWYFGENAALNFNTTSGQPQALTNSAMFAEEGCSSRADSLGNLLLYTNGETIWNRQHQPMANGTGLSATAALSATQCLIVPQPGHPTRYYVFTPPSGSLSTLRYSVVDMSRQSGLGEVVEKNTLLLASSTERVAAVLQANHRDVWLVALSGSNNNCFAFSLTAAGLQLTPVVSPQALPFGSAFGAEIGQLKASPNGRKLALVATTAPGYPTGVVELLDFDTRTGRVANPVLLSSPTEAGNCYGTEFSPDGTKLYVTKNLPPRNYLYQYDLAAAGYNASRALIPSASAAAPISPAEWMASLQLGPDGRIYVALGGAPFLSVIAQPNLAGAACDYQYRSVSLSGRLGQLGLPNFLPHELWRLPPIGPSCQDAARPFTVPAGYAPDSVRWSFGDPASGPRNASRLMNPTHTYAAPGTYTVSLTLYFSEGGRQVLRTTLQVFPRPAVDLGPDAALCPGTTRRLAVSEAPGNTYRWQDGSSASSFTVREPGQYWVRVVNGSGCLRSDTVRFTAAPAVQVRLGADTVVCVGQVLRLRPSSSSPDLRYRWQDGSTQETLIVRASGAYWVEASNAAGCSQRDSVRVVYLTPPAIRLGADTAVCTGSGPPFMLDATLPGVRYRWQDGSTNATFTPTQTGTYWVTVSTPICSATDTIRVRLYDCRQAAVFVPNIITPNGDGHNDQFEIVGLGPDAWALSIYTRWGQRVYSTAHYRNEWAAPGLPDGTYYYLLQRGTEPAVKGWLEVRR
jgi:gliding motility-associated-like protein